MKFKFAIHGVLSLLVLCFTVSCADKRDVYRMPLADNIQSLNPRFVRFLTDDQIIKAIYGQLISVDEDGYLLPQVVYRWDISEDQREYILYIRDDVFFHDGIRLTARDIKFSLEYEGKNPTLQHKLLLPIDGYEEYYSGKAPEVRGIDIVDDYTVLVKLTKSSAVFLYTIANSKLVVLPDKFHGMSEEDFFKHPIGVGRYKFENFDDREFSMVLNDRYYGDKGIIRKYVLSVMDKPEAIRAFENHEIDDLVAYNVNPQEIKRTDIISKKSNAYTTHFIFFNVAKPPLDNENVRLAIRQAIRRDELVNKCFSDDEPANGVIPYGLVGTNDDKKRYEDLSSSTDYYLKKAGVDKRSLPKMVLLRFTEMADDCFKPTVEAMFREAGLPISVQYVSFENGVKKIERGDYYLLSEWLSARSIEPINIINFFDGRSTHNLSNMNNPDINALIDMAEKARTRSARGELYRQIGDIIIRKAYAVEIQFDFKYFIYDNHVRGMEDPSPMRLFTPFAKVSFE